MTDRMRFYLTRMNDFDGILCVKLSQVSHYRTVRSWFRLMSRLGDGVFWYTLMLAIIIVQGTSALVPVMHILITGLLGTLVYKWLKGKTQRPRPFQVLQDVWLTGNPLDYFSFPSGHTLHAVIFSLMTIVYYPALTALTLGFTMMVALSRVVLGLHYPSDVLAGAAIGVMMAFASFTFF